MYQREPEYDYYKSRPGDLHRLSRERDWQIAEDQPDISGWTFVDKNDNKIGTVEDILFSSDTGEAIFAIVKQGGTLGIGGKTTLVPLDQVSIDRSNKRVIFHATEDHLKSAPDYTDDMRDYNRFYDYWGGMGTMEARPMEHEARTTEMGRERVIPEVEEKLEVEKYREQVGEVEIHKEVETHPETVREKLAKTRIHVFRRDVEPGREVKPGEQVLREGEVLEIPVVEEKLVTEKRAEVTGEVVVTPEMLEEEEEVTEELRKEHVEVEEHGKTDVEEEKRKKRY